mmetsp:Transcript_19471/g.36286  ORF Transcript_19471/g.36286 Transcript_19471/m.36286 type:complete len:189 (-) Transcript_19471:105-671(-)
MTVADTDATPKGPEKPTLFEVCVISGGALSAGFVGGVWYQFRKSKFKFNIQEHHNELRFAGKAFLAGTALCLGTFGVLTSAFMYATGVSSFLEFSYFMKTTFQGRKIDGPSEEFKKETMIFKGMTREQEWEHWSNKFKHYFETSEGDQSGDKIHFDPKVEVSHILKKMDEEDAINAEIDKEDNGEQKD